MTKFKKKSILLLAIALLIFTTTFSTTYEVNAIGKLKTNKVDVLKISNITEELVKTNWEEYYLTSDFKLNDCTKVSEDDEYTKYNLNISYKQKLKAKNALELPYIKGQINTLSNFSHKSESFDFVKKSLVNRIEELDELYIGKTFDVSYDSFLKINKKTNKAQLFILQNFSSKADNEKIPIEKLILTKKEYESRGAADINSSLEQIKLQKETFHSSLRSATSYDRIKARNYILRFTNNSGGDDTHSYNDNYKHHEGVDCANYVSQAIYAGGIHTDNTWKPESLSWIRVPNLIRYMLNRGIFFSSNNINRAFAGSIVKFGNYHVGMINHNDTVNVRFSAHSNNRKNYPLSHNYNQTYYIPVWDSYEGRYTPR